MDKPNVQVRPPGICQSDWTVSYSVYGQLSSASASKNGKIVIPVISEGLRQVYGYRCQGRSAIVFDASVGGRSYHHQSKAIPEYFSITRRSKSGSTYDVKVKYDGSNLENYF